MQATGSSPSTTVGDRRKGAGGKGSVEGRERVENREEREVKDT